jgi:hypothetical protein
MARPAINLVGKGGLPVDLTRQLRQHVVQVDDLVQARTKKVALSRVLSFPRPHRISRLINIRRTESQIQFARNPLQCPRFPAKAITANPKFQIQNQELGNSSRGTK